MSVRWISMALAALLVAAPASAHRVGIPLTRIDWNARVGVWEVVHRVSAHDLDAALDKNIDAARLYTSEAGQALIGNYAARAFRVQGKEVSLVYVGAELDADQVYIYFEMRAASETVQIDSDLLLGEGETDFAHVNVNDAAGTASYIFDSESGAKPVSLRRPN